MTEGANVLKRGRSYTENAQRTTKKKKGEGSTGFSPLKTKGKPQLSGEKNSN